MNYILITKSGRIMQFYIKATADLYQTLNGGTVVATFPTEENIERIRESVDCIQNDTL